MFSILERKVGMRDKKDPHPPADSKICILDSKPVNRIGLLVDN